MADLTDTKTADLLSKIIREGFALLRSEMRGIVREETADIREDLTDLKQTVHKEFADVRSDIKTIKSVLGQQSIWLRTIQTDVNGLKTSYRSQARETTKLGVLLEDFEHRFAGSSEL